MRFGHGEIQNHFQRIIFEDVIDAGDLRNLKLLRPRLGNIDYVVSLATPSFRKFSGSTQLVFGRDENFYEWTSANIGWIDISLNWRPTEQLRVTGTYDWQGYNRLSDGSTVAETSIPRLRVEYQLSRSIFVRVVGQYTSDFADDLRESDRCSGAPPSR